MPKGLKRYHGRGDLHFLTFSCYRRLPLPGTTRARNLFVHALGRFAGGVGRGCDGLKISPGIDGEDFAPAMTGLAAKVEVVCALVMRLS
jgi:hypothetical protein